MYVLSSRSLFTTLTELCAVVPLESAVAAEVERGVN
jgi:hypothetical protein